MYTVEKGKIVDDQKNIIKPKDLKPNDQIKNGDKTITILEVILNNEQVTLITD